MTEKTRTTTTAVIHVVQCSFAFGPEWEPWADMPDDDGNKDVYEAIGKAELFHHFMEHGAFPEAYAKTLGARLTEPVMQAIHKKVIANHKITKHKFRTRVVRRTIVSTITDEEVDKAMIAKYGKQS